jgi:hypothetical protein
MSMSAADHALEARDWAAAAADMNPEVTPEKSRAFIALAQVHATLAVAEQTRIANLQRYAEGVWASYEKDELTDEQRAALVVASRDIGALIREGLGIA